MIEVIFLVVAIALLFTGWYMLYVNNFKGKTLQFILATVIAVCLYILIDNFVRR